MRWSFEFSLVHREVLVSCDKSYSNGPSQLLDLGSSLQPAHHIHVLWTRTRNNRESDAAEREREARTLSVSTSAMVGSFSTRCTASSPLRATSTWRFGSILRTILANTMRDTLLSSTTKIWMV